MVRLLLRKKARPGSLNLKLYPGLGFRVLGFRVLGFRVLGFRDLGQFP